MWAMQAAATATVLATFVLASCGNSGSGASLDEPVSTTGAGPSTAASETVRPCFIFTLDEVEAMVGSPVTAGPNPHSGSTGCEWTAEVIDETNGRQTYLIDLRVHDADTSLAAALTLEGEPTAVPELGEEGLVETSTDGFPAVMAGYRDVDRVVTLLYEVQAVGADTVDPRDDPGLVVDTLKMLQDKIAQPAG